MAKWMESRRGLLSAGLAALIAASACGQRRSLELEPQAAEPAGAEAAGADGALPDTPAGRHLRWALEALNQRGGEIAEAEVTERFHASFLAQVPAAQLVANMRQLAQVAPLTVGERVGEASDHQLEVRADSNGGALRVSISIDPDSGQITGLLVRPDLDAGPRPRSFAEVDAALGELAARAQVLAAEIQEDRCEPIHEAAADEVLAIGSTFKLYVLLAVADRVAAGKARWDDELAIRDEWRSLPSGDMQGEKTGARFSLRHFATKMISISDNTATDHLLHEVSRAAVEAALATAGHATPAVNTPFPTTRELFHLKLSLAEDQVTAYLAMPAKERRAYLDRELAARPFDWGALAAIGQWTTPRRIAELEWFASARDLCRLMGTLRARAGNPVNAVLLEVMSENPGMPVNAEIWPYVGYKGGSEPGVLNLTWLLRRHDDRWFVVTIGLNDSDKPVVDDGEARAVAIASGIFDLLAKR